MGIKDVVAKRINQLCKERMITVNELANIAGVNPSTIYSILGTKSKSPEIVTIKKICDGLEISIVEFFNTEEFLNLEQEIK